MNLSIIKFIKQFHFKKLDSTSSFLKRHYKELSNLTFVRCDYQTSGHGRYGRAWESDKSKNLMFSFLIKDKRIIDKYDSLSLATAVSVYNSLKKIGLNNLSIKWPNDVYLNSKKISGILLEGCSYSNSIDSIVIGVGINLNQQTFIDNNATSYILETNKSISINKFKRIIYKEIRVMINNLLVGDNSYLNIIRSNNYLLNKEVFATINDKQEKVIVLGINDDNSIKIQSKDGIFNLTTGEITFHS